MMFSQNFADYYDGIVAGDPVYDLESIALSELYGVEAMAAITPAPIAKLANGSPVLYPAFPEPESNCPDNCLQTLANFISPSSLYSQTYSHTVYLPANWNSRAGRRRPAQLPCGALARRCAATGAIAARRLRARSRRRSRRPGGGRAQPMIADGEASGVHAQSGAGAGSHPGTVLAAAPTGRESRKVWFR
jgi:hypothetical protein